jgi:hypothetical protein
MGAISLKYKSKSGNLTAPGDVDPGAMIPIATYSPSGVTTVTFSDIPNTYQHLQLRMLTRTSTSASDFIAIRFNGDTGSNYGFHNLYGNGSAAGASATTPDTVIAWNASDGGDTANAFNACIFDILDYSDTNKYKTSRFLEGHDLNGSGVIEFRSGLWRNTAAITSIQVFTFGPNFANGSSIALYGIKRAGA